MQGIVNTLAKKQKVNISQIHETTTIILNQKNIKLSHERNHNTSKLYITYSCKKKA
jgi:hypothetical protein